MRTPARPRLPDGDCVLISGARIAARTVTAGAPRGPSRGAMRVEHDRGRRQAYRRRAWRELVFECNNLAARAMPSFHASSAS